MQNFPVYSLATCDQMVLNILCRPVPKENGEDSMYRFLQEDIPHLFERFYKGKNATGQSIGIGLSLSRMIVSKENGTLKAENRKEGGARFILKFYKK